MHYVSVCACAASELVGDVPVPWNLPHSVWLGGCHLSQLVDLPHLSLHLELAVSSHCQVSTLDLAPLRKGLRHFQPHYKYHSIECIIIFGNP